MVEQFESYGGKLITDARVDGIVRDEAGRVVGVTAQTPDGPLRVGANTGVLLAAGGFDYDADLRNAFLRGPIFGSKACSGNTGDGLRLGLSVGAGLGCMQGTIGGHVYLDEYDPHDDTFDHCMGYDYSGYRANPYCLLVNRHGRRFMDESTPYSIFPDSVYSYDSKSYGWTNIPGYLIFDEKHIEQNGWPHDIGMKNEEQPSWVKKFDTLEELAAEYGIQTENLIAEVERYNGFCETGVDEDWGRGDYPWAEGRIPDDGELPNKALGPVNAPYYVVMIAPGSCGTKGGVTINTNNEVLNSFGEVIEGLYAAGTNAMPILGWTYGGAGGSNGPGAYGAMKAVDTMFDLGIFA